ncbi:MAG: AmmeMemoRadiSam system radical SAM enzyme [Deltaproteobacteria bacterium]|nr:AmmeMemoRadiSam system radical SAM enzyme [Deltaproteobacteria bacterium]
MKEASFYRKLRSKKVLCELCPHLCEIENKKLGFCEVRENQEGVLYSLNYGRLKRTKVLRIEELHLFHFLPGSKTLAITTVGCNFRCDYCNVSDIAIEKIKPILGRTLHPKDVVKLAQHNKCDSITYDFTEPTIYYEYVYEIAEEAHRVGFKNIFATNGYIQEEPLQKILPLLDAVVFYLKGFNEENYNFIMRGHLEPVLFSLKIIAESDVWLEVKTSFIPKLNTDFQEVQKIILFLRSLRPDIPWHIHKTDPQYKMKGRGPMLRKDLKHIYECALKLGLSYPYVANIAHSKFQNTQCPYCGSIVIYRVHYQFKKSYLKDGCCHTCGHVIPGVFQNPAST